MKTRYIKKSQIVHLSQGQWCFKSKNIFEKNPPKKVFKSYSNNGEILPILANTRTALANFKRFSSLIIKKVFDGPINTPFFQSYKLSAIFLLEVPHDGTIEGWTASVGLVMSYLFAGHSNYGLTLWSSPSISTGQTALYNCEYRCRRINSAQKK